MARLSVNLCQRQEAAILTTNPKDIVNTQSVAVTQPEVMPEVAEGLQYIAIDHSSSTETLLQLQTMVRQARQWM